MEYGENDGWQKKQGVMWTLNYGEAQYSSDPQCFVRKDHI